MSQQQIIKEMKDRRGELNHRATEILDDAETNNKGVLTEEQDKNYNACFTEMRDISKSIKTRETALNAEKKEILNSMENGEDQVQGAPPENSWKNLMIKNMKSGTQIIQNAHQADNDESGGFILQPAEFRREIIKLIDKAVYIRSKATVFTSKNINGLVFPSIVDDVDDAKWTSEIAEVKEGTDLGFGNKALKSYPLSKRVKMSKTLIAADGINALQILTERVAEKFGAAEESAFINGSGSNQPLGILTPSKNGISAARYFVGGNSTTALKVDSLKTAKSKLPLKFRQHASWMMHPDVVLYLSKIKDTTGQYIWQQAIRDGEYDRLLNMQIAESEYMPNVFEAGKTLAVLADYSQYYIHDFQTYEYQVLSELHAYQNQIGFLARKQLDGKPMDERAFSIVKLSD